MQNCHSGQDVSLSEENDANQADGFDRLHEDDN
jgi:hypothetical protein